MTFTDEKDDSSGSDQKPGPGFRLQKIREGGLILPIAGFFLVTPPFVELFIADVTIFGGPLIGVYLFAVWAALVVAALWLSRHLKEEPDQ
ncbi:hypothetical protein [Amaricoccus tamworthensis]|uniref:hypothetical protein n=1 Tax=Amaricoccus tamworthensis TaxID=57002 RepID=UPI003C7B4AE4